MFDKQFLDALQQTDEQWEETTLQKTLARTPERMDKIMTTSSEPINRLYTPLDISDVDYAQRIGFPGEYPDTRGVHPTIHRGPLWTRRIFAGFGTAAQT